MAAEELRYFDPNQPIPFGLKNARTTPLPDGVEYPDPYTDINLQEETFSDEDSELDEEEVGDELDVPGYFEVISQTVRTGRDGRQVVDVVIDVEEVEGAVNYEVRVTRA